MQRARDVVLQVQLLRHLKSLKRKPLPPLEVKEFGPSDVGLLAAFMAVGGAISTLSRPLTRRERAGIDAEFEREIGEERSAQVTRASESSSMNVQAVASATEQTATSITEVARQPDQSRELSAQACNGAMEASSKVGALIICSEQIVIVVGSIQAIAEQTNLLAFNATIEAPHASEAGKGYRGGPGGQASGQSGGPGSSGRPDMLTVTRVADAAEGSFGAGVLPGARWSACWHRVQNQAVIATLIVWRLRWQYESDGQIGLGEQQYRL